MTLPLWVEDYIGTPYVWRDIAAGFDCYNLELDIYRRHHGITLPDEFDPPKSTKDLLWQAKMIRLGETGWDRIDRRPLCTVLIKVGGLPLHLGHYLGAGMILHADEAAGQVCLTRLDKFENRISGYFYPPKL